MATELAPQEPMGSARGPRPRTIGALWRDAVAAGHSQPPYLVEDRPGDWRAISWSEAARTVEELAHGLLDLGVRKGDAFAVIGAPRYEWAVFDFALALVGAIGAPVYANSSAKDTGYVLDHSESIGVLVEDDAQRAKVEEVRGEVPRLRHVLTYADLEGLRERGRAHAEASPHAVDEAAAAVSEDDLFTYIYTSGTTGPPKACMITHRNYYAMASVVDELGDFVVEADTMLLYLPLAHNFGRLMHLTGPYVGYTIAFLPDPLRAAEALPHVRPTVFPSVPRVYEKVHTAVVSGLDEATGLKKTLGTWALGVGYEVSRRRQAGEPVPRGLALKHRLADRLVFSKVKARLGGRLRIGISGAAPLAKEIAEFFHAIDILVLEGYGLTECTTACTVNRPERFRFGTVGPALPGSELKIADDGEILIRSETVFAGYYKDPEATAAVLGEDGWLHSGDVGALDEDGFLTITDRKKDILVTAGGKNIAPQNLENDLKGSKYISQALVVGDRMPYPAALITLDPDEIRKWAEAEGIEGDVAELSGNERVRALIQAAVDEVNAERSRFEQVKRFAILPRDFTMEEGEVTPTLKLRRRVVQERFASQIAELYASPREPEGGAS